MIQAEPPTSPSAYQVAVKKLRIEGENPKDVENYFNKEKETLLHMRELRHEHLIEPIAVYERGTVDTEKYFVFPWATGGNLCRFWETDHSTDRSILISWTLRQATGLADGLAKLHDHGTRHGDVKPANILRFIGHGNGKDPRALGTLVLADVGIAKHHDIQTSVRRQKGDPTTNKSSTQRYEPPEMKRREGEIRILSRKVDSWSMGCVLLEMVIWLVDGEPGQNRFNEDLLKEKPKIDRFWHINRFKQSQPHPAVKKRINDLLQREGKDSALGKLLDLVKKRLLVGSEGSRADSQEMHRKLLEIEQKCPVDPSYLQDRTSTTLIDRRGTMKASPSENLRPISQQVGVR